MAREKIKTNDIPRLCLRTITQTGGRTMESSTRISKNEAKRRFTGRNWHWATVGKETDDF
jgi:hypothetical protein